MTKRLLGLVLAIGAAGSAQQTLAQAHATPQPPEVQAANAGAASPQIPNTGSFDRDLPARLPIERSVKFVSGGASAYPAGFTVQASPLGSVVADAAGKTLYAMNPDLSFRRIFERTRKDGLRFCTGPCAEMWKPMLASKDATGPEGWSVVEGAQGPQWAYRGGPVFTYARDGKPGDVGGHEYEDMWLAVAYTPPPPAGLAVPPGVKPIVVDGEYVLADWQGNRLLALPRGKACDAACTNLQAFSAGMAAQGVGDWTVSARDQQAHWLYRGQKVLIASISFGGDLPKSLSLIRP